MPTRAIAYWTTTALLAAALVFGGVLDLVRVPAIVAGFAHLGYPLYVATLIGA